MNWTSKRALITGGASGIGLATVEILCHMGSRVALNHLPNDPSGIKEVKRLRTAGYDVVSAPGDVSNPGEAENMVTAALKALGGLDLLVNNAGTSNSREPIPFENLEAMDESFWQTILGTNLIGPYRCSKAASDSLRLSHGVIINTASVAGLGTRGSSLAYSASKAALINLTRNLAKALSPEIRVNAVAPGLVDTPWTKSWPESRKRKTLDRSLLKRLVMPKDVANSIIFLAGQGAITGEVLVVDCGSSIT